MSKDHKGSLGYQMMKALQSVFRPGASRHNAKKYHRDTILITSISTMRTDSADVHQFSRFIRECWPEVKDLMQVNSEMALAYIEALQKRHVSGGHIGRKCSTIRKLDAICRNDGTFPPDAPPLLPLRAEGGQSGFHSRPKPIPYTSGQAWTIIHHLEPLDPEVARLLNLMWKAGLRVTEAAYLRAQDIDLENRAINLNEEGNVNRTKGGRPRVVEYQSEYQDFFADLKNSPNNEPTGHLFANRHSLPDRARLKVRQACAALNIPCLGTHAFRKAFSVANYHLARSQGADDRQALLATSYQLGHNRVNVTQQSYVPRVERKKYGRVSMDNSKVLALAGQYICEGNIDQIRISLIDRLYKLGLLCRVKSYPQLMNPVEETNHILLIHPVWWQFGELELIDLDGEKTLVRFYQPEIPDLQDILDHESAIRKILSRPALVWFLDNLEMRGKVIELLGQELLDHGLACLEETQNRLVSSMGLNQYPLSYFELRPAPEVGISQTVPEVQPVMENRRDIPTDQMSIRQDASLRGEDLELLRLWQGGLTAKEIGQRTGKTGKTIQNRLTVLRRIQGEEKVPLRKKDDRGISWDKSG